MTVAQVDHEPVAQPVRATVPPWRGLVFGSTTPQRLGRISAALVVLCLATASVSGLSGWARADAVGAGGTRVAALDTAASQLYRSLNEAEAMATSGFATAGPPSPSVVARYSDHVSRATQRLVHAAGLLPPGGHDAALVERIASQLPRYTALVDSATTLKSEGSPRAREPLDAASRLMRETLLPAADALRHSREAALVANFRQAGEFPAAVVLLGATTLVAAVYVALRERRRTNRILNPGLVVAGLLVAAALAWWSVATFAASDRLEAARGHSAVAAGLDESRAAVLQARAAETLARVSGGAGEIDGEFTGHLDRLLAAGGLLDTAAAAATGTTAADDIPGIRSAALAWQDAVTADGDPGASRRGFERLTAALADAVGAERTALAGEVRRADAVLRSTAVGPAVLLVLAAAAAAFGIGRRIREYR